MGQPTNQPTSQPTNQPTSQPATQPTRYQKNSLFGIKKFFIWDQKKLFLVPDSKNHLFLYIFAFMDGWFGIFRASALGSLEPPKPYGSCHLATERRPNLTHTVIWRPRGTQTLRKL